MGPHYYSYAGLRVASEIHLPEWGPFEGTRPAEDPDVVISVDATPDSNPASSGFQRVITPNECTLFLPGIGSFRIRNGCEIVVSPVEDVLPDQLRPWIIGSAWGSLCYQRGLFLIHASAVMVDDAAVLFCAPAKGGKSTLAALLNTRGHSLASDDLCHLDVPPDGFPVVHPSTPRFKLWSDALGELGWSAEQAKPDHSRAGKFHVMPSTNNPVRPSPVRGIYLLEWGELSINRLSGLTALRRFLLSATYRAKLLESTEQLGRHSTRSMTILQRVPVWELKRPRDLASIGKTADLLAAHWSEQRMIKA
jgi:hypothetical protein